MAEDETIDEEIDLASLSDEDLVSQMHNDLYDGLANEIAEGTNILLGRDWGPSKVLDEALVEGMRIVGIDFRDGILFVPEVLLSANSMKAGMAILRPLLAETGAQPIGKVVIGTVKGDIHDIGKNLVGMMLEGAGFRVIDLGTDVDPARFIDVAQENEADLIAVSGLLTTSMPEIERAVAAVHDANRSRNLNVKVMVGGPPVSQDFAERIGASGYGIDAPGAVGLARGLVQ